MLQKKSKRHRYIHGYGTVSDISSAMHKFVEAKNLARDIGQAAVDVYKIGKNARDIIKK